MATFDTFAPACKALYPLIQVGRGMQFNIPINLIQKWQETGHLR